MAIARDGRLALIHSVRAPVFLSQIQPVHMAFLTRLFAPQRESRATMADILKAMSAGATTKTGISVTPTTALTYTAVLAGVRILAESVASLPAFVYQRNGADRSRAANHILYPLAWDLMTRLCGTHLA